MRLKFLQLDETGPNAIFLEEICKWERGAIKLKVKEAARITHEFWRDGNIFCRQKIIRLLTECLGIVWEKDGWQLGETGTTST